MVDTLISMIRPYQFKGKARLLGPWTPRAGTRLALVHGYRVELELEDHIQRMVYLGAYERWESAVVRRWLHPGMCFADVGANVGYFTLLAARRVGPRGRVFAVEPSRYAVDRLGDTVARNSIPNVRIEPCGLGSRRGEVVLYEAAAGNHTPSMLGGIGGHGSLVPVRTLDELVHEWGVDQIDLLKIDVEGYEPEVFAGAEQTLADGKVRAILCEFNAHWLAPAGTSSRAVYQGLLNRGFVDRSGLSGEPGDSRLESRLLVWGSEDG
jgi:FkbM family methyltransferase